MRPRQPVFQPPHGTLRQPELLSDHPLGPLIRSNCSYFCFSQFRQGMRRALSLAIPSRSVRSIFQRCTPAQMVRVNARRIVAGMERKRFFRSLLASIQDQGYDRSVTRMTFVPETSVSRSEGTEGPYPALVTIARSNGVLQPRQAFANSYVSTQQRIGMLPPSGVMHVAPTASLNGTVTFWDRADSLSHIGPPIRIGQAGSVSALPGLSILLLGTDAGEDDDGTS